MSNYIRLWHGAQEHKNALKIVELAGYCLGAQASELHRIT